jgi:di/tricarboxylate transporter
LFAIFAATILGIILKAAPMGTMCMMAIGFTALTQVLVQVSQLQSTYRIWRQSNLVNRDIPLLPVDLSKQD